MILLILKIFIFMQLLYIIYAKERNQLNQNINNNNNNNNKVKEGRFSFRLLNNNQININSLTDIPTSVPSSQPSSIPSTQPSSIPSTQPSSIPSIFSIPDPVTLLTINIRQDFFYIDCSRFQVATLDSLYVIFINTINYIVVNATDIIINEITEKNVGTSSRICYHTTISYKIEYVITNNSYYNTALVAYNDLSFILINSLTNGIFMETLRAESLQAPQYKTMLSQVQLPLDDPIVEYIDFQPTSTPTSTPTNNPTHYNFVHYVPELWESPIYILYLITSGVGVVLIMLSVFRNELQVNGYVERKILLERQIASAEKSRSSIAIKENLSKYIDKVFPIVYSNKKTFIRILNEFLNHHRYFGLISNNRKDKRIVAIAQYLTMISTLFFILSLAYNYVFPESNGSCNNIDNEIDCLGRVMFFWKKASYCSWIELNLKKSCVFNTEHRSIKMYILIGLIISMYTALINILLDYVFIILSSPTEDNNGFSFNKAARRVSIAATGVFNKFKSNNSKRETITISDNTRASHDIASASLNIIANVLDVIQTEGKELRDEMKSESQRRKSYEQFKLQSLGQDPIGILSRQSSEIRQPISTSQSLALQPILSRQSSKLDSQYHDPEFKKKKILNIYGELCTEIYCQRRLIAPSELAEYDGFWGISNENPKAILSIDNYSQNKKKKFFSNLNCFKNINNNGKIQKLILNEIAIVHNEVERILDVLSSATESHTGLEILHLFIMDILGRVTPAARIFQIKARQDFRRNLAVSNTKKSLSWSFIIIINILFVGYTLNYSLLNGTSWQEFFYKAAIMQIFFEVFIFETFECIWVNFLIPDLVSYEVMDVANLLHNTIESISTLTVPDLKYFLDAPPYFFISTNIAKSFPNLLESVIIRTYHNHLPGKISTIWKSENIIVSRVYTFLVSFAIIPFELQRLSIRLFYPLVLLIIGNIEISDNFFYDICIVIISSQFILLLMYIIRSNYVLTKQSKAKVGFINEQKQENPQANNNDNVQTIFNIEEGVRRKERTTTTVKPPSLPSDNDDDDDDDDDSEGSIVDSDENNNIQDDVSHNTHNSNKLSISNFSVQYNGDGTPRGENTPRGNRVETEYESIIKQINNESKKKNENENRNNEVVKKDEKDNVARIKSKDSRSLVVKNIVKDSILDINNDDISSVSESIDSNDYLKFTDYNKRVRSESLHSHDFSYNNSVKSIASIASIASVDDDEGDLDFDLPKRLFALTTSNIEKHQANNNNDKLQLKPINPIPNMTSPVVNRPIRTNKANNNIKNKEEKKDNNLVFKKIDINNDDLQPIIDSYTSKIQDKNNYEKNKMMAFEPIKEENNKKIRTKVSKFEEITD